MKKKYDLVISGTNKNGIVCTAKRFRNINIGVYLWEINIGEVKQILSDKNPDNESANRFDLRQFERELHDISYKFK